MCIDTQVDGITEMELAAWKGWRCSNVSPIAAASRGA